MNIGSIEDVVKAGLCAGCGICEAICGRDAIEMKINGAGFYRPHAYRSTSDKWEVIRQVCPGVVVTQENNTGARGINRLWGPIRSARVGYSTNEALRWRASSGGALSALLIALLEEREMDYVVHIGVTEADPLQTVVCKSYTPEQVLRNSGSRYAPSAPLVTLSELLRDQSRFALVGKPCDIAALRAYGKFDPRIRQQVMMLFSFFCAGTPSMRATDELVSVLGVKINEVKELRYRGCGWPGRATIVDEQGQEYSTSYEESWGRILGRRLQFRCKICPDGVGGMADITAGDAWHVEGGRPSFDERPGQSIILARTAVGQHYVECAERAGYLHTEEFPLETLGTVQPSQKYRQGAIAPRLLALRLARRPFPKYVGFYLASNARHAGPWAFFREYGGMLRRLAQGKACDG